LLARSRKTHRAQGNGTSTPPLLPRHADGELVGDDVSGSLRAILTDIRPNRSSHREAAFIGDAFSRRQGKRAPSVSIIDSAISVASMVASAVAL
jgi:hypothetical protein